MQYCRYIAYSAMQYIFSNIYNAMCVRPFIAECAQCMCGLGSHDSMECHSIGVVVHMSHDLDADDHELQDEGLF